VTGTPSAPEHPPAPAAPATRALTPATIKAWENSDALTKRIAASLARKINMGEIHRYAELPSSETLADQWDASGRTALRAKALLAEHGLLTKEHGTYYVAAPPPRR
jgi:DNA-binding GntR family transcriptional regulator